VSDVDYVVKLIDVYPDTGMKALRMNGYPFMVANDVFRARFRKDPAKFVPNIFEAKPSDFRAATQRLYRSKGMASKIGLPVVTGIRP
jgi:predicted acyl esterase